MDEALETPEAVGEPMPPPVVTAPASAGYSTGAILLHWAVAAAMLFQISLGWRLEERTPERFALFQLHKSVGITILLLTLARIGWRLTHRPPPSLVHGWEQQLARAVHVLFYALLLAIPLSGWLIVSTSRIDVPTLLFGIVPWPHLPVDAAARAGLHDAGESAHKLLAWLAVAAIGLHVAGALKHQLLDRDGTFARMAPGATRRFDWRLLLAIAGGIGAMGVAKAVMPASAPRAAAPAVAAVEAQPAATPAAASPVPVASPGAAPSPTPSATPGAAATRGEPARWAVQPGGRLGFAVQWNGKALAGSFGEWDSDISFDPAALDKSRVKVAIRTGSARTGEADADGALPEGDWLSATTFPTATFEASRFRNTGGNRYVAEGTLSLRGKTQPLSLNFTLDISGDTARMTGSATVDRVAYGVGWPATDEVGGEVRIDVSLTARRQG